MDPRHLSRLYEEQRKAFQETKEKIEKFEKFKSDYRALQQRLKTLPDNVTHDVMVPFGKFAFMPGKIVHTNEILVLLGDNWFAERSAKQAYHIADRRIQELDKRIEELQEQHDLLAPRLGITSELQAEAQGFGDMKEIVEEYDEEKEKQWDERHRQNIRRSRAEQRRRNLMILRASQDKNSLTKAEPNTEPTEEYWSRLDALERQEAEQGELHSSFEEEEKDHHETEIPRKTTGRRVSWIDEKEETSKPDSDESTEDEADEDDGNEEDSDETPAAGKEVKRTITFSHTKTSKVIQSKEVTPAGDYSPCINSPGDIYKLFAPKSILKQTHHESETEVSPVSSQTPSPPSKSESKQTAFHESNPAYVNISAQSGDNVSEELPSLKDEKAFTGLVVEKSISDNVPNKTEQQSQSEGQEVKRISKFKAQRMKQGNQ